MPYTIVAQKSITIMLTCEMFAILAKGFVNWCKALANFCPGCVRLGSTNGPSFQEDPTHT